MKTTEADNLLKSSLNMKKEHCESNDDTNFVRDFRPNVPVQHIRLHPIFHEKITRHFALLFLHSVSRKLINATHRARLPREIKESKIDTQIQVRVPLWLKRRTRNYDDIY